MNGFGFDNYIGNQFLIKGSDITVDEVIKCIKREVKKEIMGDIDKSFINNKEFEEEKQNIIDTADASVDVKLKEYPSKSYVDTKVITILDSIPTEVQTYIEEHKSELKGDTGEQGPAGVGIIKIEELDS